MLKQGERQAIRGRLMLAVAMLNVAGIMCLSAATRAPEPEGVREAASAAAAGRGAGWSRGWASVLDSLGFTLMLPGTFFASSVFLGSHIFGWSERATRAAWYAAGFGINLLTVWRVGVAWHNGARETDGR